MKMIWALIRSESVQLVIDALEKTGIHAMTRINVAGPIRELGLPAGSISSAEMSKEMLMFVLADCDVAKAVVAIRTAAKNCLKNYPDTGKTGNGKIFITYVEDFYTLRTGQ
ncbi:MAG: nitrogen fixation protein NifD [Methanomicrobiales archaeon HGW-Methanomicrobiales-1]|jgi:nitrogen regulatory protein PII 1|nr:MAG: nitrogen fixation protein NifD [Methanomicrobiales archaeon HGW-Methanomicrobiales-1]